MTLDQIDLVGNGFDETPDAFIKSHTMDESVDAAKNNISHDNTLLCFITVSVLYMFHHNPVCVFCFVFYFLQT